MCTAISFSTHGHYFGRNLDLWYHYNEAVTVTPRKFPLLFRDEIDLMSHYAMIGIAIVSDGYPLYYDATNEHGLSIAALNFPGHAQYHNRQSGMYNIASFELIPWLLGQCRSVKDAIPFLQKTVITNCAFSDAYPPTPLHFMLADKNESIVIEPTQHGLQIYDNPFGVLTNAPPFPFHLENIVQYSSLTPTDPTPKKHCASSIHGLGTVGLPGDFSSVSRFIRSVFVKENTVCEKEATQSVSQFFHILDSVAQPNGCVRSAEGLPRTVYSSCCDAEQGIYYYTTYENRQITAVHLFHEDIDSAQLSTFPLITTQKINTEN